MIQQCATRERPVPAASPPHSSLIHRSAPRWLSRHSIRSHVHCTLLLPSGHLAPDSQPVVASAATAAATAAAAAAATTIPARHTDAETTGRGGAGASWSSDVRSRIHAHAVRGDTSSGGAFCSSGGAGDDTTQQHRPSAAALQRAQSRRRIVGEQHRWRRWPKCLSHPFICILGPAIPIGATRPDRAGAWRVGVRRWIGCDCCFQR